MNALACVPDEQLMKLWQGLGYYSRARSLKKAAGVILEQYGGTLPQSAEELKKLPGIGDYTAGAIASIAYGLPEPAVDGNVLRVAARLTASHRDISDPAVKKELHGILQKIYPKENAGAFTQSLMELGATVCLPNGSPLCEQCPLAELCEAHKKGEETALPVKGPKPERKQEDRTAFLFLCGEKIAVRKRPKTGLLAGLWEFPNMEGNLTPEQAETTLKQWNLTALALEPLPNAKHVFSHIEWHMTGYLVRVSRENSEFVWPEIPNLFQNYAVPSAFQAYLKFLKKYSETKQI